MDVTLEELTENENLDKSKVVKLYCSYSKLTILPDISTLSNLTQLYCGSNKLTDLSMSMNGLGISTLINLTHLYCAHNQLTELSGISMLVNLTHLECRDNKLTNLSGISSLVNLIELDCAGNKLTDLSDISALINLTLLDCGRNQLTDLSDISALVNLTYLYCSDNQLTNLSMSMNGLGITGLVNLVYLDCSNNKLTDLSGISTLVNLVYLDCGRNQLTNLSMFVNELGILTLVNLVYLDCSDNQLTDIYVITALINLTYLNCSCNQLTNLSVISALVNLTQLICPRNQLTALPHGIIACRRLEYFDYTDNPIEYIPLNIQRFIGRMRNTQTIGNIYNDSQSVHRSSVTNSVRKSIENLLGDKTGISSVRLIEIILKEPSLADTVKSQIIQYIEDKEELVSSMVTFEDVLSKVIARIISRSDSEELFKILSEQMTEAECMCLTGRISRLVSTLDGFYDDIRIEVSSTEVISAIILQVTAVPGTTEERKAEATRRLLESGYDTGEIEQWIAAIE